MMILSTKVLLLIIFILSCNHLSAQRKFNKERYFENIVSQVGVTISDYKKLKVVDTALFSDFYPVSTNKKHYFQIFRTLTEKSDTNYIIALNFYPKGRSDTTVSFNYDKFVNEKKYVPETVCFRFEVFRGIYNYADRCKDIMPLDKESLKKVNADIGFIYTIKMDVPFKERYKFCEVLSYQNLKKAIVSLYYFHNSLINDDQILQKMYDQIGLISINN